MLVSQSHQNNFHPLLRLSGEDVCEGGGERKDGGLSATEAVTHRVTGGAPAPDTWGKFHN